MQGVDFKDWKKRFLLTGIVLALVFLAGNTNGESYPKDSNIVAGGGIMETTPFPDITAPDYNIYDCTQEIDGVPVTCSASAIFPTESVPALDLPPREPCDFNYFKVCYYHEDGNIDREKSPLVNPPEETETNEQQPKEAIPLVQEAPNTLINNEKEEAEELPETVAKTSTVIVEDTNKQQDANSNDINAETSEIKPVKKTTFKKTELRKTSFFGIFTIEIPVTIEVNSDTGIIEKEEKPWWSFLFGG